MLLVIALLSYLIIGSIRRRRQSIVGVRGFGTAADIGRLHDVPRVRVGEVTVTGPESARLVLVPASDAGVHAADAEATYLVAIDADEPAFGILQDWRSTQQVLGAVAPSDSRILRLRSLDDLQPLTLRRLDV